ncbi:MAG: metallophosphoesterase family protein [Desulfobulbaceae bacterium]
MRIAVLADIHANLAALEAVLEDIAGRQVSEILCLGDSIGYGPDPGEVLRELRRRGIGSILGNHEYAALNRAYLERMNPDPKRSLEMTLPLLSAEDLAWIADLEPVLVHRGMRLVHGCPPKSPTCYLFYPNARMLERFFLSFPEQICFYGHTHVLSFFEEGLPPEEGMEAELATYRLHPDRRYLINPGSVGQPRDGINNQAKYLLWDPDKGTVSFLGVPYEVQRTVNRLHQLGFPEFNAQRLVW